MNNNTNNMNSNIPEEVLELLPWYTTGKLSTDDKVLFDKALVKYPLLAELLEQEIELIETVTADKTLLEASALENQEERLKSVLNMIDIVETQNQAVAQSKSSMAGSLLQKLKNSFDVLVPNQNGSRQFVRVASLGVLVLSVAVLTAFVAPLFNQENDFVPASAQIQPNDEHLVSAHSSKTALLVGFNGTSIQLGNNEVLKDKLMKIESVPDKEGIYQISFKQVLSPDEVKQTIDALLKQKDLIWFAGEEF